MSLVEWAPPKNENQAFFAHFTFEGPLSDLDWAPLSVEWAPCGLKIDPCRPDMGPPKHVSCLFSMNFGGKGLQSNQKWAPSIGEGGCNFTPFIPPPAALLMTTGNMSKIFPLDIARLGTSGIKVVYVAS